MILKTEKKTFEMITPVIMAGIDRLKPELRSSSLKGIFRWWFRFFFSSNVDSSKELREYESEVFGSTERACPYFQRVKIIRYEGECKAYLRMNDYSNRRIMRKAIKENTLFSIEFSFLPKFDHKEELFTVLELISLFGGVGARWRRGFGSIQLIDKFAKNLDDFKKYAQNLLSKRGNNYHGEFININNVDIFLITPNNLKMWKKWDNAMDDLREDFYRKFKRKIKVTSLACRPKNNGKRSVSPVIIQIKRIPSEGFFGVLIIYKNWDKYNELRKRIDENFFENLTFTPIHEGENRNSREVKLCLNSR